MSCENCFCHDCEQERDRLEVEESMLKMCDKWSWHALEVAKHIVGDRQNHKEEWYSIMKKAGYSARMISFVANLVEELED